MPVPSSINDLSTTASSNSPSGGDSPGDGDDYIRALSAFIASQRDKLNGTATGVTLNTPTIDGGTISNVTVTTAAAFSATPLFNAGLTSVGLATAQAGITVGNTAQASATTLDYYLEGTFTPTVIGLTSSGSCTYSDQTGRYTRIGNRVFGYVRVAWTSHTGTGLARISSAVPIAAANASPFISCAYGPGMGGGLSGAAGMVGLTSGATYATPYSTSDLSTALTIASSGSVSFSFAYEV